MARKKLLLLLAPSDSSVVEAVTMTLGWMCREAGVLLDTYFAADHAHGGLFAPHGSPCISGDHGARIARALATFDATVVRLDGLCLFDSLLRASGATLIDAPDDLRVLYQRVATHLCIAEPTRSLVLDVPGVPQAVFYPECAARRAMVLPEGSDGERLDFGSDDPALACVQRYARACDGIDLYEPLVARYMLAFNQRSNRLILPYESREQAVVRRDQLLTLRPASSHVAYGRWFGDPQLQPLASVPMAYQVVEPHRNILTCFADAPVALPQPKMSWVDMEPTDEQLHEWAAQKKILASWLLHSGELSHDDSVLAFMDWSSMTKVKIGAGVHWQRYHFDPDVVEPMHVPVAEGGVLGLVEPVLHSAGAGIIWETSGDPGQIAALMRRSRDRIAEVAGERFAPRGVYCFSDVVSRDDAASVTPTRIALWEAIHVAGFEYVVSSCCFGTSRVLYRDGDFVVLSQAGKWDPSSPFVRGTPETYTVQERRLVEADVPGWMLGAIDTPIHGSQIYIGRPYGKPGEHPRLNEFYDYVEQGGTSGRVVSATPRTIARYARLIEGDR